ncbi:MAG: hypothetical protein M0D53_14965 [Flavobacterium sp. JAD_PAG50586_2]|nr:MAG: hypothetical protein M0D53_14965 [Flavobacterium sp. JAD_PAG50586_2]
MKKYLILLTLFLSYGVKAQTIEYLQKGDTLQKPYYQQFIFICDSTDMASYKLVARIKATGSLKHTTNLYYSIKDAAQSKGANAYKLESLKRLNATDSELILSTYYVDGDFFNDNFKYIPKNKVFVFGNDDLTADKEQGYKVQGDKHTISSGQYKVFHIGENDEIKVSKGGITGMAYWFKRKEYGHSSFITFSGFGINGATANPGYNGVGVSFNTGKINNVEPNLALFLVKIYEEKK